MKITNMDNNSQNETKSDKSIKGDNDNNKGITTSLKIENVLKYNLNTNGDYKKNNNKFQTIKNNGTESKDKNWIMFFKIVEIIALIGFIVTLTITLGAVLATAFPAINGFITTNVPCIAPIFMSYIKTLVLSACFGFLFFSFKFFVSSLSEEKPNSLQTKIKTPLNIQNESIKDKDKYKMDTERCVNENKNYNDLENQ